MQRAVAEDPSLAAQYPHLGDVVKKGQANAEKEKGNAAFAEKRCTLVFCACTVQMTVPHASFSTQAQASAADAGLWALLAQPV